MFPTLTVGVAAFAYSKLWMHHIKTNSTHKLVEKCESKYIFMVHTMTKLGQGIECRGERNPNNLSYTYILSTMGSLGVNGKVDFM